MSAPTVEQLLDERIDARHRGFGAVAGGLAVGELGAQGYDLRRGDLPLPLLVLRRYALEHNLRAMQAWCDARGLALAPHGKTAMAPQLMRRQLEAGAWGLTAATVQQVAVMRAAGARRVILANQLVDAAAIGWLERERAADDRFEAYCLVDSAAAVAQLNAGLAAARSTAPLAVLIELGGARAGCRTDATAHTVAAAVAAAPRLALAGVEGYEGTLGADREPRTLAAVGALFDRVAERLRFPEPLSRPLRVVVRAGCYVTHDDGHYARLSPLTELRPALELWARVLSCPQRGLAIAGFGKRDAPYDLGLPIVRRLLRDGAPATADGVVVDALNDQHAMLRDPLGALRVGDVLRCGISHPCTAFDKWSLIPVVDDADVVVDAVRTLF